MRTHDPEEDEGQPIDMRLADIDLIQDLFYSDAMGKRLNYLVNARKYVAAMRDLRILCRSSSSDAHDIASQWRCLCGIIGDDFMADLLSTPLEWQQLVYLCDEVVKPWRHHDDYVVVWLQKDGKVVARRSADGFYSFVVEKGEG